MTLYLSRLRLNRRAGNEALRPLLDPDDPSKAISAHHRLLWTAFADGPDRRRDFLWRADDRGLFYTLSERPPAAHDLFDPPEVKEFAPVLSAGDRLSFVLRANATKDRASAKAGGGNRRVDLVMDLLKSVPKGARAEARSSLADQAARGWMERQGALHGFALRGLSVEGYATPSLGDRPGPRSQQARLGILDLAGVIEVTDSVAFTARLGQGFGRAKAFGCGLMLIRRA